MVQQTIKSFDGTKIAFNHSQQDGRDTVMVICHGFGMCKDARPFLALSKEFFKTMDVMNMDLRGHGNSGGRFSFSALEPEDIKALIEHARKSYRYVYLMGFSLGGSSSIIEVAREKNVDGLISVSAPMSFETIENRFLDKRSILPFILHFRFLLLKLRVGGLYQKKVRPVDVIDQVSPIPLLLIQGDKDPIVFTRHAQMLFDKAREPKELLVIKGGIHAEYLFSYDPQGFMGACTEWLKNIRRQHVESIT